MRKNEANESKISSERQRWEHLEPQLSVLLMASTIC